MILHVHVDRREPPKHIGEGAGPNLVTRGYCFDRSFPCLSSTYDVVGSWTFIYDLSIGLLIGDTV
jgi:hypothetical protein